jgi:hypothetical protein
MSIFKIANMMDKFLILTLLLVLSLSFSCKTLKSPVKKDNKLSVGKIYDSLEVATPVYSTLDVKFNLKYTTSKQAIDLKGTLKIANDSLIWISLGPGLGIEGVRFMCNKDSLYILDRVNKTYRKGNYNYIKENWKIDIDFNILQSILSGKFFLYPDVLNAKNEFISTFNIKNDANELIVYRKNSNNVENLLKIDQNMFKITEYLINDVNAKRNLTIIYTYQKLNSGFQFPKSIEIRSLNAGQLINVNLEYTKVQVNNNLSFSFSVPSSYSIIDK